MDVYTIYNCGPFFEQVFLIIDVDLNVFMDQSFTQFFNKRFITTVNIWVSSGTDYRYFY